MVGSPFRSSGEVKRPSRMSGNGREALPDIREWSGDPPKCSVVVGGLYEYLGVVGFPSQMSESCWKTLQDVRKWSGVSPKCPGVVGRPSLMSLSSGRPFWMFGSCREDP